MNSTGIAYALDRVPPDAPNRESLANLLTVTEAALAEIARDEKWAEHPRRIHHVAALLWLMECCPPRSQVFYKVRSELSKTVDAARAHARRHNLHPNGWGDIMSEARLVLDSLH